MDKDDFKVLRKNSDRKGSGYIEIGKGESYEMWVDGNMFIEEEAFLMVAGIFEKHAEYNHIGQSLIQRQVARKVAAEWRNIAGRLESLNLEQAVKTLNLPEENEYLRANLSLHKREIAKLLRALADGFDEFCDKNEFIYINGV